MSGNQDLLTLEQAAALVPGGTADMLKRRARQGKLRVYRVGKRYLTTQADINAMAEACRVTPAARPGVEPASADLASAALDATLAQLRGRKRPR